MHGRQQATAGRPAWLGARRLRAAPHDLVVVLLQLAPIGVAASCVAGLGEHGRLVSSCKEGRRAWIGGKVDGGNSRVRVEDFGGEAAFTQRPSIASGRFSSATGSAFSSSIHTGRMTSRTKAR